MFGLGTLLVVFSVFLYSYTPKSGNNPSEQILPVATVASPRFRRENSASGRIAADDESLDLIKYKLVGRTGVEVETETR